MVKFVLSGILGVVVNDIHKWCPGKMNDILKWFRLLESLSVDPYASPVTGRPIPVLRLWPSHGQRSLHVHIISDWPKQRLSTLSSWCTLHSLSDDLRALPSWFIPFLSVIFVCMHAHSEPITMAISATIRALLIVHAGYTCLFFLELIEPKGPLFAYGCWGALYKYLNTIKYNNTLLLLRVACSDLFYNNLLCCIV